MTAPANTRMPGTVVALSALAALFGAIEFAVGLVQVMTGSWGNAAVALVFALTLIFVAFATRYGWRAGQYMAGAVGVLLILFGLLGSLFTILFGAFVFGLAVIPRASREWFA